MGDLLISGADAFISFLSGELGKEFGANAFGGGGPESIRLGTDIKKVPNETIDEANILGGARA